MTALVAVETLLLVLLVALVTGLLRSHAEILRRLGPPDDEGPQPGRLVEPGRLAEPARRAVQRPGHDLAGVSPDGDAVQVGLGAGSPPTLVAFLSSGCSVCRTFWSELRDGGFPSVLPSDIRLLAVTKAPEAESPARVAELAGTFPVLMSSEAWRHYGVPGSPYFVYLEGGRVAGEGAATGWEQISSLLGNAIADAPAGERRAGRIDRTLAAAGIGPGHPSLYPSRAVSDGQGR